MNGRRANRVRRFSIPDERIDHFFQGEGIIEGLPDDVTLERGYHEPDTMEYVFILHSQKFSPVEEGLEIPEIERDVFIDHPDSGVVIKESVNDEEWNERERIEKMPKSE